MKRIVYILCMLLLLPALAGAARAEDFYCAPEAVDLSLVREENGRLVGEILLPPSDVYPFSPRLMIDCPIPEAFPPAQQKRLCVAYRTFDSNDLAQALSAIGQDVRRDALRAYDHTVLYEAERHFSLHVDDRTRDLSAHPKADALLAAKETARALLAQLGASVSDDFFAARRNTVEEGLSFSPTASSANEALLAHNRAHFLKEERKAGRNGEDDLSLVQAFYALEGLPVMFQYTWPDGEGERYGDSSYAQFAVRDGGEIVYAEIAGIPDVLSSSPCAVPVRSWQETLRLLIAHCYWPSSSVQDTTYESSSYGTVTNYASYEVITDIAPCWVGRQKDALEPGYSFVIELHVQADDSLDSVWLRYTAAADMERVN